MKSYIQKLLEENGISSEMATANLLKLVLPNDTESDVKKVVMTFVKYSERV